MVGNREGRMANREWRMANGASDGARRDRGHGLAREEGVGAALVAAPDPSATRLRNIHAAPYRRQR